MADKKFHGRRGFMLGGLSVSLGALTGCQTLGTNLTGTGLESLLTGAAFGGGSKKAAPPPPDLYPQLPLLDGMMLENPVSAKKARRGPEGGFLIEAGVPYEFKLESYCMGVGGHSKPGGKGYTGMELDPDTNVAAVLRAAGNHPEVRQSDIQMLIWGLLPTDSLAGLSPELLVTARRLLTAEELAKAGDTGLGAGSSPTGMMTNILMQEAQNKLKAKQDKMTGQLQTQVRAGMPESVQRIAEKQREVQSMLSRAGVSYDEVRAAAVQEGEPPEDPNDMPISEGRWSLHPDGYLMQFASTTFTRTSVRIFRPRRHNVTRDALGRITEVSAADGYRCRTAYDDKIGAVDIPGHPDFVAYLFKRIDIAVPYKGKVRTKTWKNRGWVLKLRRPGETGRQLGLGPVQLADASPGIAPEYLMLAQARSWWDRLTGAKEAADEAQERYETYKDVASTASGASDANSINNLFDQEHYQNGVETATTGSSGERIGFVAEHHRRQSEALTWITALFDNELPDQADGTSSGAGNSGGSGGAADQGLRNLIESDPTRTAAQPGSASTQTRGISSRPAR